MRKLATKTIPSFVSTQRILPIAILSSSHQSMAVSLYASLLNLAQFLDEMQQRHEDGKMDFDEQQVQILQQKVHILLTLLETLPTPLSSKIDTLVRKLSRLGAETELLVDAEVVEQVSSTKEWNRIGLSKELSELIQKLDLIIDGMRAEPVFSDLSPNDSIPIVSSTLSSSENNVAIGLAEKKKWLIDELISQNKSLQVIPIIGMGGIGKTTLAKCVFETPIIKRRFDIHLWCTVSRKYDEKQILNSLLQDESNEENREKGTKLYQKLHNRRYLIVFDDMWSVDPWEYLKKFLPDNDTGSRVIVTTRMPNLADSLRLHPQCIMDILDEDSSWSFLCEKIFNGKQKCPEELEKIGRDIAKDCKGLPISLVTVGGLLSKSSMNVEQWKYVAQNVRKIASNGDCMKLLYLSYYELPMHLKLCFLYFRTYSEDEPIDAKSMQTKWIVEGFVKTTAGKSREDVSEEYLKDLIDRNLILVHSRGFFTGKVMKCGMHDLLHDLCLAESKKENFFRIPRDVRLERYSNRYSRCATCPERVPSKETVSVRFCKKCETEYSRIGKSKFRLRFSKSKSNYITNVRSARMSGRGTNSPQYGLNLAACFLWNLQMLEVYNLRNVFSWRTFDSKFIYPDVIWEMKELKSLISVGVLFPEPRRNIKVLLQGLETLSVDCLPLEVVKRIPNLKILRLILEQGDKYSLCEDEEESIDFSCFQQLQSLGFKLLERHASKSILFPCSLNKLMVQFEYMSMGQMTAIASIPNLEILELRSCDVRGVNHVSYLQGCFPHLKVLALEGSKIEFGSLESENFPNLEKLKLEDVEFEIPSWIGDIPTLLSIHLKKCSACVIEEAVELLKMQRDLGNDILELYVEGEAYVDLLDDETEDDSMMKNKEKVNSQSYDEDSIVGIRDMFRY